jgi:hypothetical protein
MRHTIQCGISAIAGSVATLSLVILSGAAPRTCPCAGIEPNSSSVVNEAVWDALQQGANVKLDDENAAAFYANFARVTATPEEVIIDFALNPQPFATGEQLVKVSHRSVMNFYTTKRLFGALEITLKRHEDAFGPIELDVRKRAKPGYKDK